MFLKKELEERFEFWVGQILTVICTVVGVYLAATSGFNIAVKFEEARSERENYFLQTAFLSELKDNISTSKELYLKFKKGQGYKMSKNPEEHIFNTYIWEMMQESPNTFQVPINILSQGRSFYKNIELARLSMLAFNSDSLQSAKKLNKIATQTEKVLIPAIEKNIFKIKNKLKGYDFEIE